MTDPRLGTTFARYTIEAVLGRGGMGVVYRAHDPRLDRSIALKVLPHDQAAEPEARTRFLQEVRLAARIENAHIVTVYEADEWEGQLYLAMRYIRGHELGTLIEREGALAPARAVGIIGQVAEALEEAHAAGLVHRDVKPANILIEPGPEPSGPGHAWLTDFGLARLASAGAGLTRPDLVVGTPGYVAPEQIDGGTVDHRADIYALGCVLYNALTGEIPYPRDSTRAMLWAHLWERPPVLADRSPALAPFDPVIAQALAKAPADRFQTARALADAARRAAAAVDPAAPRLTGPAIAAPAATAPAVFERTAPDLVRPGAGPEPGQAGPVAGPRGPAGRESRALPPGKPKAAGKLPMPSPVGQLARRLPRRRLAAVLAGIALAGLAWIGIILMSASGGRLPTSPSPAVAQATTRASHAPSMVPSPSASTRPPSPSAPSRSPSLPAMPPDQAAVGLFRVIPPTIQPTCQFLPDRTLPAWLCDGAEDVSITYERASSLAELRSTYDRYRKAFKVTQNSGSCRDGTPGEGTWKSAGSEVRGRLLCTLADSGSNVLEWTDERVLAVMTAYGPDAAPLYRLWDGGGLNPAEPAKP